MTNLPEDPPIADTLGSILDRWRQVDDTESLLSGIRRVIESVRERPRGKFRIEGMNTIVRTLGQPDALADLLDMMRSAASDALHPDFHLTLGSQRASRHSLYGWSGQTSLIDTSSKPQPATVTANPGLVELMSDEPALWNLSLHVWQPNPRATRFTSGCRPEPDWYREPPHSHPFDFSSMIVSGEMHQSTYYWPEAAPSTLMGRYSEAELVEVDSIWPPHASHTETSLGAIDQGVQLATGDSYFMPTSVIHDVQVHAVEAQRRPAISLFLSAEAVAIPYAYIPRSMAEFHDSSPDLKARGRPLPFARWSEKLERIASHLRDQTPVLDLSDVVMAESDYGFFIA